MSDHDLPDDPSDASRVEFYGGRGMSALPLAIFIAWAIVQSGLLGIGDTSGLVIGMLVGLVVGMLFVKGDWKSYADVIFDGMTQRVAATAVVAWLWAGMFAETLQVGRFVEGLVWLAHSVDVGAGLFPSITFILAALLATGIGTGYGTTIAFCTLFFPAGVLLGCDPVLLFGAILAGDGLLYLDEQSGTLRHRSEEDKADDAAGADSTTGPKGIPANLFGDIVHKIAELGVAEAEWPRIAAEYLAGEEASMDDLDKEQLRTHAANAVGFVTDLEDNPTVDALHHELFVTTELSVGEIVGFIDLLAVTDDAYHVIDYKTSNLAGTTADDKAEEYQPQLDAYAVGLHQANPERAVKTTLLFTETGETVTDVYDPEELPSLATDLETLVNDRIDGWTDG